MERTGFVFLPSYLEAVEKVPEAYRLEVLMALCQFGIEGVEPEEMSAFAEVVLSLVRNSILHGKSKYQASRDNGKKGGRPKKEKPEKPSDETFKTQETQENQDKEKDIEKDKEKEKDIEKDTQQSCRDASSFSSDSSLSLGTFSNVRLTQQELDGLKRLRPCDWQRWIEDLSTYIASSGKRYENHYAALLSWIQRQPAPPGDELDWDAIDRANAAYFGDDCYILGNGGEKL